MGEPWINFSDVKEDLDLAIFLRPDGLERVHVYLRAGGTFGLRNFIRENANKADSWEVGSAWGHHYDSVTTAIKEAAGHFLLISEFFLPNLDQE